MRLDSAAPVLSQEDIRLLNAWWRASNYLGAAPAASKWLEDKLAEHKTYVQQNGIDMPEVREWELRQV